MINFSVVHLLLWWSLLLINRYHSVIVTICVSFTLLVAFDSKLVNEDTWNRFNLVNGRQIYFLLFKIWILFLVSCKGCLELLFHNFLTSNVNFRHTIKATFVVRVLHILSFVLAGEGGYSSHNIDVRIAIDKVFTFISSLV